MIIIWTDLTVKDHWNALELVILDGIDSCAPLIDAKPSGTRRVSTIPSSIKNKINTRKRLIHLDRLRSSAMSAPHIKILNNKNVEI